MKDCSKDDFKGKLIVSAIKGIIPQYNLVPADYFSQHWDVNINDIGIIAGPCHAEEVALERLSYLTAAFMEESKAIEFTSFLKCRYINVSYNNDLIGTEYCAVLKNVYAIGAGICHGLGYGDNFQAVLVSNAIREAEFLLDRVSPKHRDVKSSAYLGYLLFAIFTKQNFRKHDRKRLFCKKHHDGNEHGGRRILCNKMYRRNSPGTRCRNAYFSGGL